MSAPLHIERFDPAILQQLGRIDLIAKIISDGVRLGLHKSRRRGFSTEFSEFKPYAEGDDLRLLDWRVYARTDRLFVKCFEAETSLELMLLLDATASMAWRWEQRVSKLEYGANLLAALACLHMRQQDQVGLLVSDAESVHHLPPRCRRAQLESIYQVLENAVPGRGNSFPMLIESLAAVRRHRGAVVICADLEEDDEAILEALELLAGQRDDVVLFHILAREEIELPFDGITHLRDSETATLVPADPRELREEHKANIQQWRQQWRDRCERNGILYLPVDTGMNYIDVLRGMLAARQHETVTSSAARLRG